MNTVTTGAQTSEQLIIEHKFGKLSTKEQQWLDRVHYIIAEINYKMGLRLEIGDADILEAISRENLADFLGQLLEPYVEASPEILDTINEAAKYGIHVTSFGWEEHEYDSRLLVSEVLSIRGSVDDVLEEYRLLEELSFLLGDISTTELIVIIHEGGLEAYLKTRNFDEEMIEKYKLIGSTTRHSLKHQLHNGPLGEENLDFTFQLGEDNDLRFGRKAQARALTDSEIFRGEEIRDINPNMAISREEQIDMIWGSEVGPNEERYELGGEVGNSAHKNLALHHKKSSELEYGEPFEFIKSAIAVELIATSLTDNKYTFDELYQIVRSSYNQWIVEKRKYVNELKRSINEQYASLRGEQKITAKEYYNGIYMDILKWDKILFNGTGIFQTIFDYLAHSLKEKRIIEIKKRVIHGMRENIDNSQDFIVLSKSNTGKISEIVLDQSIAFHGSDSMLFVN